MTTPTFNNNPAPPPAPSPEQGKGLNPKKMRDKMMSGPLPGEHFTSDTKSQPWHRPPRFETQEDAMEHIFEDLVGNERKSEKVVASMEVGLPISVMTEMYLQAGIGMGKWTVDFALLLAGPTAHLFKLMGDMYGVKYEMGLDEKDDTKTGTYMKHMNEPIPSSSVVDDEPKPLPPKPNPMKGGFMEGL